MNIEKIIKAIKRSLLDDACLYDLNNTNPFFEYIFVATAKNQKHLQSAIKYFDLENVKYKHIEGLGSSDWVLIDAGNILVHLLTREARELYGIDNIYIQYEKQFIDDYSEMPS